MRNARLAISIDRKTLNRLDRHVKAETFASRSSAIQEALQEKLDRLERTRLAQECANLDPTAERAMAEEGLPEEFDQWPEY